MEWPDNYLKAAIRKLLRAILALLLVAGTPVCTKATSSRCVQSRPNDNGNITSKCLFDVRTFQVEMFLGLARRLSYQSAPMINPQNGP